MFWSKKKKAGQTKKPDKNGLASYGDVGTSKGKGSSGKISGGQRNSADIRAEALANARAARERIGEETIQKIADALVRKQMSLTEQAKKQIAQANSDRVAQEIRFLMDDNENTTRH
jgi:hypothetical protein